MEGLFLGEFEVVAHISGLEIQRALIGPHLVPSRDQFTVEEYATHLVPHGSSWCEQSHCPGHQILVIDPDPTVAEASEQKEVAFLKVVPQHRASKPFAHPSVIRCEESVHMLYGGGVMGRHHRLDRFKCLGVHVEAVHHSLQEQMSRRWIWNLSQKLQQPNHDDVLFMLLESFVDLTACAQQFYTELCKSFGFHLLPLAWHALELVHQLVVALQTFFQQFLGQLTPHVLCRMGTAHGDALFPASRGKKGKQLDQCFKYARCHGMEVPPPYGDLGIKVSSQGTLS